MGADTTTTQALLDRLRRHYIRPGQAMPGGVFLPEVGMNGGWGAGRRCDAIYVGFTSTSGRLLVGHELKVSRSDWLNELNHPGKADTWADQCHQWWLVVPDPSIVHEGELPAGWGLMSPSRRTATRMQVHTPATEKPADQHTPSWDVVRSILARQDTLRAQALDECRHKEQQERSAEVEKQVIAANGLDTTWRDRCQAAEEKLNAVIDSLGGYGTISFRNGTHTQAGPEDIADLVALLRSHNSVKDARRALFGGWSEPLRVVDQALATLRTALVELDYATKPVNVSHDT